MTATHVVVGGGVPGIVAALTLARHRLPVVLVEAAPELGGLLRSPVVGGYEFDLGTHFANRTGEPALDDMLFGEHEAGWVDHPVLRAGNVVNGVLNSASENPDLNSLGSLLHDRCLAGLLGARGWACGHEAANAREYLVAEYGTPIFEHFLNPLLEKLTGCASEALHPTAHLLFNLKRFAVLDTHATAELKRSPLFDGRVAYHHRDDYQGHRPCRYPRRGGIGQWIGQLSGKLRAAGVRVLLGATIDRVLCEDGRVAEVRVGGAALPVHSVVWTVSPIGFCRAAGVQPGVTLPEARATVLVHILVDRPFSSDCYYVTIFDPAFHAFRVTLYQNFRSPDECSHAATVEFLTAPGQYTSRDWFQLAVSELQRLRLLEPAAKVTSHDVQLVSQGFPVQTTASVSGQRALADEVRRFSNVRLSGRASGEHWFLEHVTRHAHEAAKALVHESRDASYRC
jgi:protoporphyrinogen oxidase